MKKTLHKAKLLLLAAISLAVGAAWADLVASWDGDLADNSVKNDKYTMSKDSNDSSSLVYFSNNTAVLGETSQNATKGIIISWPDPTSDSDSFTSKKMTVCIQYSGLKTLAGNMSFLTALWGSDSTEYMVRMKASNSTLGIATGVTSSSAGTQTDASPSFPAPTKGKLLVSFSGDSTDHIGMDVFVSTYDDSTSEYGNFKHVGYWSGATVTNGTFYGIKIGGTIAGTGAYYRPGMTIEAVSIYDDVLDSFKSDLDSIDSNYTDYVANFSQRIMTLTSTGTSASTAVDISGDSGTFALYDLYGGTNTTTTFTGSSTTTSLPGYSTSVAAWQGLCKGKGGYVTPGLVLRFPEYVSGKSIIVGNAFSPLTLGGLIVDANASSDGVIPNFKQAAGQGNRVTQLGDTSTTGGVPTFFTFNDSFDIEREKGDIEIYGDATFSIASGKTLYCNTNYTSYSVVLQSSPATTLRCKGDGTMKVVNLDATASGATLDFSALSTTRETSFIQGKLTVGDNTTFAFPSGASFPYQVATSVSGSMSEETTFTVGSTEYTHYMAFYNGYACPATKTTLSESKSWSALTDWDITYTDYTHARLEIDVTANATLNFDSTVTASNIVFNIDEGVTLTLSGTAPTVSDEILVTGKGKLAPQMTISSKVNIDEDATVQAVYSSTVRVSNFTGSGTIIVDGNKRPSTSATAAFTVSCASNSLWTGTVWLKDYQPSSSYEQLYPHWWSNPNSKIKWTNVKGYLPGVSGSTTQLSYDGTTVLGEWILEDDGDNKALTKINGYSGYYLPVSKLSGSGTLQDTNSATQYLRFEDISGFTGTFALTNGMGVVVGGSNANGAEGKVVICSGYSGTVSSSATWYAKNGIVVNGTLNVSNTVSSVITVNSGGVVNSFGTISLSGNNVFNAGGTLNVEDGKLTLTTQSSGKGLAGTVNIKSGAALENSSPDSDVLKYDGSANVNVYGTLAMGASRWTLGASNYINLYSGEISGTVVANGNLDMNNNNGTKTIYAYGDAEISATIAARRDSDCQITVDSGKTLTVSGRIFGDYSITKNGEGTLKLTYEYGNTGTVSGTGADGTTFTMPTLSAGTIELAGSGTWSMGSLRDFSGYAKGDTATISITQTQAEYGAGSIEVTNLDSSITSITVNKYDGTTATITPEDGTATLSDDAVLSGSTVCLHDYEFNNAWTDSGSDQKDAKTWNSDGTGNFCADETEGNEDNYFVYTSVRPGNQSTFNFDTTWTAAIRCTIPQTAYGVIVGLGTKSSYVALVAGSTTGEVLLVKGGGDNVQYTELAKMYVAQPTENMHVYVFKKTSESVTTYCDGELINVYSGDIGTISDGFQFGTTRGGFPSSCGLVETTTKSTGGMVDYMRIYPFDMSETMVQALADENPCEESSTPTYTRTVSDTAGWWWASEAQYQWTKSTDGSQNQYPAADAIVEITTAGDSAVAMTVNLPSDPLFEALTFQGDVAISLVKSGDRALNAVKLNVKTDVTIPYALANFSSTRVSVDSGKTLTFDFSSLTIASQTERHTVYLTGVTAAPEDLTDSSTWPVQVVLPSDIDSLSAGYISLFEYDSSTMQYVYTYGADHTIGSDVYYTGGYWSSDSSNTISVTNSYGETTTVFEGDTVVIPAYIDGSQASSAYFAASLPDNVESIRVEKDYTFEPGETETILDGVDIEVASGCTLTFGATWRALTLGAVTFSGSGSVKMGSSSYDTWLNGAVSGEPTITIDSGNTLKVGGSASIANTIAGEGTVYFYSVPSSALSFGDWTGTVELPSFAADGHDLNNYGILGSTIKINGVTSGWLKVAEPIATNPNLYLAGDFNITAMSTRIYTFQTISGSGSMSFATTSDHPSAITIAEIAEGYTGSIVNNTTATLTITTLALAEGTDVSAGTKLLSTSGTGTITVSAVTVGGEAQELTLIQGTDGIYVKSAITSGTTEVGHMESTTAVITESASGITIPSTATAVVTVPTSETMTLDSASTITAENVTVKYGTTDITGAFTVTVTTGSSIAFALNSSGSVTVDEETIAVTPAVDTTAESPMDISDVTEPTFTVKTIPGLWYQVVAGTEISNDALSGTTRAGEAKQAISTTTTPVAPAFSGTVQLYRIAVGATESDMATTTE